MPIRHRTPVYLLTLALLATTSGNAAAHPASGIVVDDKGQVFFCQHGQAVWKIFTDNKLTRFHEKSFHWLALDPTGAFAKSDPGDFFERITPAGAKPTLLMGSDFPFVITRDGYLLY